MDVVKIPAVLHFGDNVAIVSPSGIVDSESVYGAAELLRSWELCPVVFPHALSASGRYAGTVDDRISDLTSAFADPKIKAIFCSRGGYGAVHLLPFLSKRLIFECPKWLIGYSDITLLLAACLRSGVASIHAPMCRHLYKEGNSDEAVGYLRSLLFGEPQVWKLAAHELNRPGNAFGKVIGGNLAVFSGLRGTNYDFDYDDKILFIEDIGERPYQIERMMYNLKLGGVLKKLSGLLIGQFSEYEEDRLLGKTVYEMIADLVEEYDYPVCFNFPVGHVKRNYPLVVGGNYRLSVLTDGVILDGSTSLEV